MQRTITVLKALGIILLLANSAVVHAELRVRVDVTPTNEPTVGPVLEVTIHSEESESVHFYESDLPWHESGGFLTVLTEARFGNVWPARRPIADPGPGVVTLRAGETIRGRIQLIRRYSGVKGAKEFVLFWTLQMQTKGGLQSRRVGGWFPMVLEAPEKLRF